MAAKSLTPFYVALGAVAVAGVVLIVRSASNRPPPLSFDSTAPRTSGPRGIALGPDTAKLVIWEFSDFECPWCARYATMQMPDVQQRLLSTGKVRWVFLHYPLQQHTKGPYAHLAAACANEQGKFWEMHDLIYQNQDTWINSRDPVSLLAGYATQAGVDRERYDACVRERRSWGQVIADKTFGDSVGGQMGTPTFFINGRQWTASTSPTVDQLLAMADSLARPAPAGAAPARR